MVLNSKKKKTDEENNLYMSSSKYGSLPGQSSMSDDSSRGNSDVEEGHSSMKERKKRRMEQRQFCNRPRATSKLSAMLRQNDSDDDIRDLIISSLDPNAKEVRQTVKHQHRALDNIFRRQNRVNLSMVRAKYRHEKRDARYDNKKITLKDRIVHFYKYNTITLFIKKILFAKNTIVLFVYLDLLVDLLFCLTYIIQIASKTTINLDPNWLFKYRNEDLWFACLSLTCWNLCSFIIRFFIAKHPATVLFSFRCCIELVTSLPFIISIFLDNGQYLYVPYFLRSWVLLLRIKSVMKIKMNLQIRDKPIDPLKTKLVHLVAMILVLIYNGACAFQYTEDTFATNNYSLLDSFYVVMVTLSTVGYGDITPSTSASRVVMMLLIVIALAVLPSLISDVSDTLQKRREGEGHVSRSTSPFILIVGSLAPDQVAEILEGFINQENSESHLSIIFLDNRKPSEQLKMLERKSIWGHRVQFLHGSVLDEKTLLRVEARYAEAIFTISDQSAPDPAEEDERNTVRLWSLHCHTVSHKIPIYTYNLSPSTAIYQKVAKEIICVREFKQYLLAMNCRCRGASTLLTNLLHQRQPINKYDEGWQAQYDDGSCNEIYTERAQSCIIGLTFGQAALFLFEENQVILFAVKTFMPEKNEFEILLNPSNAYRIKYGDECVYIAEGPDEIKDIESLFKPGPDYFVTLMHDLKKAKRDKLDKRKISKNNSLFHSTEELLISKFYHQDGSTSSFQAQSYVAQHDDKQERTFSISKLPSKRHALLTGSRALIKRIGKKSSISSSNSSQLSNQDNSDKERDTSLPLCYLLHEPVELEDITIHSTEGMSNHVLVCLHRQVINMFKFIYNLRSPHIKPEEIQDIVLLCSQKPSQKMFELISTFPRVYFMEGNCRQPDDLLRAGAKRAKQVVVMSEKECLDQYERNSDSPAVMASHILDLLLQERPRGAYTIVNLVEKLNIRFMHLLQGKDVAEEIDVFYTPAYASGDVIADSLISNVLLSQTYYKPDIVSIIKTLCGMPGPLYDGSAAYLLSTKPDIQTATTAACLAPHLTSIPMPPEFIGKSYSKLFKILLIEYEVLAIGLYRDTDEALGNELPFVYTNPVPSLILRATDMVYVFSPPGWIM